MRWIGIILAIKIGFSSGSVFVTSLKAQLFEEPRLGARAVGELRKGEEVKLIEKRAGWALIEKRGQRGWVFEHFISNNPTPERISLPEIRGRRETDTRDDAAVTRGGVVMKRTPGAVVGAAIARKDATIINMEWLDEFLVREDEVIRFEKGEWP
ncbi:MAG: SH3 domain-containing protein [Aquificaceae bacterium]|nr:SH3 domain-containing protein [Aquificaceae bacterium]MDW8237880.1 SH3 domain-containing protein [Aquificaceae bacterium]